MHANKRSILILFLLHKWPENLQAFLEYLWIYLFMWGGGSSSSSLGKLKSTPSFVLWWEFDNRHNFNNSQGCCQYAAYSVYLMHFILFFLFFWISTLSFVDSILQVTFFTFQLIWKRISETTFLICYVNNAKNLLKTYVCDFTVKPES